MNDSTHIVLISCPDRAGIVAEVSGGLARRGLNILDADQHTDPNERRFFMRVVFEAAPDRRADVEKFMGDLGERLEMSWRLRWSIGGGEMPRVAVVCGRETHCLSDLLWRAHADLGWGDLACSITGIVSNHEDARPIAHGYGAAFTHLPVDEDAPDGRADQERALVDELDRQAPDLVVLARYMRVLGSEAVARYPGRIINIHHSFLPAFAGARPYHRAFERGVKLIGATAHYVTEDLDEGPIIAQQTRQVSHRDTVGDLMRKGRDLERIVLADAVRAHLQEKVLVWGRRTVVFD